MMTSGEMWLSPDGGRADVILLCFLQLDCCLVQLTAGNSDSVRFHDVIFILVLLRNGSNTCTNSILKPLESVSSADCIILVFAVFSETVQFLKCYFIMYMFGSAHIMVRKTMKGNICFVLEFCLLHIVAKMVRLSEHAVLVMNLHFIK